MTFAETIEMSELIVSLWESKLKQEMILRKLLWLHHGCPFRALYSDDGEMQCFWCQIDFKCMPVDMIERRFEEIGISTRQEMEQQKHEHEIED